MFCHTCFASHNTWLAGSAVGLRTEFTYLDNKREGWTCCLLIVLSACEVWYCCVPGMALDTRMDEDGYRKPLLARRTRRVETHASLLSSHNVIHDGLLVSSAFQQQ